MERNAAKNFYSIYKDHLNLPHNAAHDNVYQQEYMYDDNAKDRGCTLQNNAFYNPGYKTDDAFKADNVQNYKPYGNYNFSNYKDSQYSYYDQYKLNMSLSTINNFAKNKDSYYYNYYNRLQDSGFRDDGNISSKSAIVNPINSEIPQYMYANCYGYATPSYPNQNYCSYPQNCNEETSRLMWDGYQANRRYFTPYVPPQPNSRIKENFTSDYYGSNPYACHTDGFRHGEKIMYAMNVPAVSHENMYNNRSVWPLNIKYQSMPQNIMNPYGRYNYVNDTENFGYCINKQHNSEYAANYPKQLPVHQKHILPKGINDSIINPHSLHVYNELPQTDFQHQLQISREGKYGMSYVLERQNANCHEIPTAQANPKDCVSKNYPIADNAFYDQTHSDSINLTYNDDMKTSHNKTQNVREFLSSWNEDEDEYLENVLDNSDNSQAFLKPPTVDPNCNVQVENIPLENQLQFKSSFLTGPKIHVGITVDSNLTNSQYINLPDIIIDIEKSKDSDVISRIETGTENEKQNIHATDCNKFSPAHENLNDTFDNCSTSNISKDSNELENKKCASHSKSRGKIQLKNFMKKRKNKGYFKIIQRVLRKVNIYKKTPLVQSSHKLIRIKSVLSKAKYRRRTKRITKKKDKNCEPESLLYNPKSLKHFCINIINSEDFRLLMRTKFQNESKCFINLPNDSFYSGKSAILLENDNYNNEFRDQIEVPKLSALCEYALSNYSHDNIIMLTLNEDALSNLFVTDSDLQNNVIISDDVTLYEAFLFQENISNTVACLAEEVYYDDDLSKDLPTLHHEEIVPDNNEKFRNKILLNYLQNKYIPKRNFLKSYVVDKIFKKYRRHINRKRNTVIRH